MGAVSFDGNGMRKGEVISGEDYNPNNLEK